MTRAFLVTGHATFSTEWRVVLSIPKSQLDWVYETFLGILDNASKEAAWITGGETDPAEAAAIFDTILDSIIMYPTRVGEVFMYSSLTPPPGCLLCDGTVYLKTAYPALAAVLAGTGLVVDATHFKTPALISARFPRGTNVAAQIGVNAGLNTVTLTTANLPAHHHSVAGFGASVAATPGPLPVTVPGLATVTGDTGTATPVTFTPLNVGIAFMIVALDPWDV